MVSWKPCCCAKCENCKGPMPGCLLLHVDGVTGTNADELNGYFPLATSTCLGSCSRGLSFPDWRFRLVNDGGHYYLRVYSTLAFPDYSTDPQFLLDLGAGRPKCTVFVGEPLAVPYNAGWQGRHPESTTDYSAATAQLIHMHRSSLCECKTLTLPNLPCGPALNNFGPEYWGPSGTCWLGRYPWGGVRIEIEGADISDLDGIYDMPGPPCAFENGSGDREIGWRIELPEPVPLDVVSTATHMALCLISPPAGAFRIGSGVLALIEKVGNAYVAAARRWQATPSKDCLGWDEQPFDGYDSGDRFKGGTVKISALDFPPA